MAQYSHPDYPNESVPYSHLATCPACGFEKAESHMHIVEWIACCIRDQGGCGHIWSLEGGGSYGFAQDVSQ